MATNINKLDTKGYWAVGTTPIYVPSYETKIEHSNVTGASTGRSEDGIMRIDWVRRNVYKVYLKYAAMSAHELAFIMTLMQGQEFVFHFIDAGVVQQIDAYVGETSYNLYTYSDLYDEAIYTDVEIHVIEK